MLKTMCITWRTERLQHRIRMSKEDNTLLLSFEMTTTTVPLPYRVPRQGRKGVSMRGLGSKITRQQKDRGVLYHPYSIASRQRGLHLFSTLTKNGEHSLCRKPM